MASNQSAALALIGLGANIPSGARSPAQTLKAAIAALEQMGVELVALSPFYETKAWPDPSDPPFMNGVALVRTGFTSLELLTLLHEVETAFGRKRSSQNAPRPLDLDLLDHGAAVMEGALVLPHPRLAQRRFVLEPLRAVAPNWRHPVTGLTPDQMLAALSD